MSEGMINELVVMCTAGTGLLLLGCLVIPLTSRWTRIARMGATAAVLVVSAIAPVALGYSSIAAFPPAIIATIAGIVLLLGSRTADGAQKRVVGLLGRSATRAGLIGAAGLAFVSIGMARFDAADNRDIDQANSFVSEFVPQPVLRVSETVRATTDTGRPAKVMEPIETRSLEPLVAAEQKLLADGKFLERVIRLGPVGDTCNCHGWVFTGGRFWVSQDDVEHILVDNGYQTVSDPRPGDLAIYRSSGLIMHTAVVRAAAEGKQQVLVEGKWGWMGVFLHGVNDCCCGKNYTFYRSPRNGHLLAGIVESADQPLVEPGHNTTIVTEH